MDQLSRSGKRELICLLLFTCNYVVSVWRVSPLPLGAWDGICYFIVAIREPSIKSFLMTQLILFQAIPTPNCPSYG